MSIWTRISDALQALATGESLAVVFAKLRTPPEKTVGFTIAVIALSAKMAKADGAVSRAEVVAFREIFHIPKADEPQAARVFNLARQDVAGFDHYARQIKRMFGDDRTDVLEDLLEGLFHIAGADGDYHGGEDAFLRDVAQIFGIGDACYRMLRARHIQGCDADPFEVLGVTRDMPFADIKAAWQRHVRAAHPDALIARGVPSEGIKLAEARMIAINKAWEDINAYFAQTAVPV